MKFNNEKCKIMHIGQRNPGNEYMMTNDNTNLVTKKHRKRLRRLSAKQFKMG